MGTTSKSRRAGQGDGVLVTGGAGYFGRVMVGALHSRGLRVRSFDLHRWGGAPEGVEQVSGDIRSPADISRAVEGVDTVYHCVAQVPLARRRRLFWEVNLGGAKNLLEAARNAGVRKIVHLSTSAVYGIPVELPVTELTPPAPLEDYGRAKLAAEEMALEHAEKRGLDVTIIRPRTILGHTRLGIFEVLFDWVREGRDVYVLGRGDNLYQFVHADDLAEACLAAARRPGPSLYNIGAERFCSMRETLRALTQHAGTGSRVRSLPLGPTVAAMKLSHAIRLSPFVPYHWLMYGRSMYFDVTKAREELHWKSRFSNTEMMVDSYRYYLRWRDSGEGEEASRHLTGVSQGILKVLKYIS